MVTDVDTYGVQGLIEDSGLHIMLSFEEIRQKFHIEPFRDAVSSHTLEPSLSSLIFAHPFSLALDIPNTSICLIAMLQLLFFIGKERFSLWCRREKN